MFEKHQDLPRAETSKQARLRVPRVGVGAGGALPFPSAGPDGIDGGPSGTFPVEKVSSMATARPKHLNLFVIRQPLPAVMSILHRVSGVLLFLFLPLLLWLLQKSLGSPQAFDELRSVVAHPVTKLALIVVVWSYLHHFCAGLRHLAFDMHVGGELRVARASSAAVFIVSLALTAIAAVSIW
jgi:succinate dehydrogenase / fumarate reductase cytochrome b subunit